MNFSIEARAGYLDAELSGSAELRAFYTLLDAMIEHESWTPGTSILVDETKLDIAPLAAPDVRDLAELCIARRTRMGAGKLALLVARDLEYGMGRMLGVFVEDRWSRAFKVFRNREDAVAWLTA